MSKWSLAVPLTFLIVALSGCVSSADTPDANAGMDALEPDCVGDGYCGQAAVIDIDSGRDLRTELTADDSLDAPEWQIGDVFEQHVFYGSRDSGGEHIKTMVVDDSGSCYQFGTTSTNAAAYEATFDLPFLGCIEKTSLDTTAFDSDWSWMYDFPLEDGKSWEGSIEFMYNWNSNTLIWEQFTLTASYNEKIDTPKGLFPGFEIIGLNGDGEVLLEYNYVPAVGWFSHFWLYDLDTDDSDDVVLHMMNMGTSTRYTGTYYIDDSEWVFDEFSMFGGLFPGTSPPVNGFDMPADATYMRGFVIPIACPGAAKVALVTPSNQVEQYDHQNNGDPANCAAFLEGMTGDDTDVEVDPNWFTVHFIDQPAEGGDWTVTGAGTGIGGWYVRLSAIWEVAYELTEDMLPAEMTDPAE